MTTETAINLSQYDIVLAIDKSGSMGECDGPGGISRWQSAREAASALARKAAEFDADGITVAVFANSHKVYDNVTEDKVGQVFAENEPNGGTDTAGVLKTLFDLYFNRKASGAAKPTIIQVITDGQPNDKNAVKRVIVEATQKMDADEELAVQFLQFGKDPQVPAFLKELDDDLTAQGAKFDIVDYKTAEEAENLPLAELLIQAVTD